MGTNGSTMLEPLRQGLPPIDVASVSSSASCA
ncbi:ATP-binding protein, partial [Streptomyces roseolilacinus]